MTEEKMLEVKPITRHFNDLELVRELNKAEFPRNERMPIWMLLRMTKSKKGVVDFLAFYDDDLFIGFISLFTICDLTYVALLAVNSKVQSKGYGSRILGYVKELYPDNRVTINIEVLDENAANSEQRKRRRAFYLKNGYESSGIILKMVGPALEVLISCGSTITKDELFTIAKAMYGTFTYIVMRPFSRITSVVYK